MFPMPELWSVSPTMSSCLTVWSDLTVQVTASLWRWKPSFIFTVSAWQMCARHSWEDEIFSFLPYTEYTEWCLLISSCSGPSQQECRGQCANHDVRSKGAKSSREGRGGGGVGDTAPTLATHLLFRKPSSPCPAGSTCVTSEWPRFRQRWQDSWNWLSAQDKLQKERLRPSITARGVRCVTGRHCFRLVGYFNGGM